MTHKKADGLLAWIRVYGVIVGLAWSGHPAAMRGDAIAAEDAAAVDALLGQMRQQLDDARKAIEAGRPGDAARFVQSVNEGLTDLADQGRGVSAADLRAVAEACETLAFELAFDGLSISGMTPVRELLERRAERIRGGRDQRPDRQPPPAPADAEAPPSAMDSDGISFSASIAGVLVAECGRCHGAAGGGAGGLSMATFADLADSGVIEPGNGAESLFVRKLTGVDIDGQRMPRGRPPLADAVIATIRQWIDEGATLDLLDGSASLETIASEGRARNLSHDQLRELRFEAAPAVWRRGIVDEDGLVDSRETLCVIGNLPADQLSRVADLAEDVESRILRAVPFERPLVKGGMAVFVFAQGYDFSNFWQNVVGQERPRGMMGHSGVDGDVVYAAVALDADERNQRLALTAEITAAALRSRSAADWFAEGAGRSLATRLVKDAAAVATWRDAEVAARSSLGGSWSADDAETRFAAFFTAAPSADQVAISSAMLTTLDRTGRRLANLVEQLDKGLPFEEAFQAAYRVTPEDALRQWATSGPLAGPRR